MVYLNMPYNGFPASSTAAVLLPPDVESALIAQGRATAAFTTSGINIVGGPDYIATQGGNSYPIPQGGLSTPTALQGLPRLVAGGLALGSLALTSFETNGVAQTAGTFNTIEIYVPYFNVWTGIGVLNGTTVGTNKYVVGLWGTNGALIANSAVAGVLTANASVFQNVAFTNTVPLLPGRYIIGVQLDGTTDTVRHMLVANGAQPSCSTIAGTFGTVPSTITVPSTFTTALAPISWLYT